jgi:hypothetical protein
LLASILFVIPSVARNRYLALNPEVERAFLWYAETRDNFTSGGARHRREDVAVAASQAQQLFGRDAPSQNGKKYLEKSLPK